jgi:hypothetical protein
MGDVVQFRSRAAPEPKKDLPPNEKRDALLRLMESGSPWCTSTRESRAWWCRPSTPRTSTSG